MGNPVSTVFYKKVGKKYIPVSEWDADFVDSIGYGSHLLSVQPGGSSRRKIDPEFAPLIAAARYAENTITAAIMSASDLRPSKVPVTQEQRDAWAALAKAFGEDQHMLQWPAAYHVMREIVDVLQTEATLLLSNPAVKNAYEEFMIVCKLAKESK